MIKCVPLKQDVCSIALKTMNDIRQLITKYNYDYVTITPIELCNNGYITVTGMPGNELHMVLTLKLNKLRSLASEETGLSYDERFWIYKVCEVIEIYLTSANITISKDYIKGAEETSYKLYAEKSIPN